MTRADICWVPLIYALLQSMVSLYTYNYLFHTSQVLTPLINSHLTAPSITDVNHGG